VALQVVILEQYGAAQQIIQGHQNSELLLKHRLLVSHQQPPPVVKQWLLRSSMLISLGKMSNPRLLLLSNLLLLP